MLASYTKMGTLLTCLLLVSCASQSSSQNEGKAISWDLSERGLRRGEQLIPQYLDSETNKGVSFYLYSFTTELAKQTGEENYQNKTILFCSGGPGQNVRMLSANDRDRKEANFVDIPGYRIVYFHLRGSGLSQIPESNAYDKYLRTHYAVEDIERIRKVLLGDTGKWAAVVGYSYGTVLAQQYAHRHPESLQKLILAAPYSRHQFISKPSSVSAKEALVAADKPRTSAKETLLGEMEKKNIETLEIIYSRQKFNTLATVVNDQSFKLYKLIIEEVAKVLRDIETVFGGLPELLDNYEASHEKYQKLKVEERESKYKNLLDYSSGFFEALRSIRFLGWFPAANQTESKQNLTGLLIADEVLRVRNGVSVDEGLKAKINFRNVGGFCESAAALQDPLDSREIVFADLTVEQRRELDQRSKFVNLAKDLCTARQVFAEAHSEEAKRVFYVMSLYDGIGVDFLEELTPDGNLDLPNIFLNITRFPGKLLRQVGQSLADKAKPWDPAAFSHDKPTLILTGSADPVSAGKAADHIYNKALRSKEKAWIELPGVGHSMEMPSVASDQFVERKACQLEGTRIQDVRACLFDIFLSEPFGSQAWHDLLLKIGQQFCDSTKGIPKDGLLRGIRITEGNHKNSTVEECNASP